MATNISNPTYNVHYNGGVNITYPGARPEDVLGGAAEDEGGGGKGGGEVEEFSVAYMAGVGTILTFLVFIAVVGNLLVVAAVFTDRRLKRNSNFFIVSLATADLIMALVVMTFAIANDIHGRWVFGAVFCRIWISSDIMGSTASILNLCVISFDRFKHIKDPLRYESWMTTRKTVLLIAGVWFLSVLISFVPTHLNWHTYPDPSGNNSHSAEECIFELNPTYAILSSCVSFYIPCIIMVSIYVRLYVYARRHAEVIRKTYTAERFQVGNGSAGNKGSYKVSDHKAALTLGVIMGVFLVCWFPFFVVNLVKAICDDCIPHLLFQILTWAGYANSCLNPIIYSIFNTEFRDAFRRILFPKCVLERRKQFYTETSNSNSRARINKCDYTPPLTENGSSASAMIVRKNSKDKLFGDKTPATGITSL
jgi:dopamine D1-like receptor